MELDNEIEKNRPSSEDNIDHLNAIRKLREATERIRKEGILSEEELVKKFTIVVDDLEIIIMPTIQGKKPQVLLEALEKQDLKYHKY